MDAPQAARTVVQESFTELAAMEEEKG